MKKSISVHSIKTILCQVEGGNKFSSMQLNITGMVHWSEINVEPLHAHRLVFLIRNQ